MEATKISIMKSNPSIMSGGFVLASTKRSSRKSDLPKISIREPEPENLKDSDVIIRSNYSS